MTSTPSVSGRPRSRIRRSGLLVLGGVEGGGAVGGGDDVELAGLQVDPQRPEDLGLVVDDQDAHQVVASSRARGPARACGAVVSARSMVRPPPGVSSASREPPMASARPRERASPSPMPGGPCRSPERWKGRKARSRSSGGSPGPWSMTRMCSRSAWALAATVGGDVGWRVLQGVGEQVGQDALQQGWVGHHLGQVVGQLDLNGVGGVAEFVDGQGDDFGDACRLGVYAERAGLEAAHVEQVLDQAGEQVQGLVGGGEELLPVALVEDHVGDAQALRRRPSRRPVVCAGRG